MMSDLSITAMLVDSHARRVSYLRLAVTDRCNFRCLYCMPPEGMEWLPPGTLLQDDEIVTLLGGVFLPLGIRKVRLTGGEPLLRRDFVALVARIAALPGLEDLSLTTNGVFLATLARPLAEAGLGRVNVSLDSLRPDRFREITRGGDLSRVLRGLDAALETGLRQVKVNVVAMHGRNADEILDLAALSLDRPLHVRFIEVMPLGDPAFQDGEEAVKAEDIRRRVEERYALEPVGRTSPLAGPAAVWRIPGAPGTVGFISPMSQAFCEDCNRLRLTADGQIKACLMRSRETDLLGALRGGDTPARMQDLVREALAFKPLHHQWGDGEPQPRNMSRIGG
jgi:cyclic pyranopterin phosphate synthase